MVEINTSNLKRKPGIIKKYFDKIDKQLVVNSDIRVVYPDRYNNINLSIMGSSTRVVSIFAILDSKNNYAVSNLPIFINLTPSKIDDAMIDGVLYKVLYFDKDTVYTDNVDLMLDNRFLYDLFNEFYIQGKIPWYMGYDDVINIFKYTSKYANSSMGNFPLGSEVLASVIAKSPLDKTKSYRTTIKSIEDTVKYPPGYVGLMNPFFTFDNTTSKLAGSYYSKGVSSAVVNKEDSSTKIEEILRA